MSNKIVVDSSLIIKVLFITTSLLILLSTLAIISKDELLILTLYVGVDTSITTWYSSITILFCSLLLGLITWYKASNEEDYSTHWFFLTLIFFCMSIDEVARVHEGLGNYIHYTDFRSRVVSQIISIIPNVESYFGYSWVLVGIPFVILVALFYIGFIKALPQDIGILFVVSGFVYVVGAVGFDMLSSHVSVVYGQGSLYEICVTTVEETLEMVGILIFAHALMSYIKGHTNGFIFHVLK